MGVEGSWALLAPDSWPQDLEEGGGGSGLWGRLRLGCGCVWVACARAEVGLGAPASRGWPAVVVSIATGRALGSPEGSLMVHVLWA